MTDQYWQLEKEFYTINVPSDLVLRVVEHQDIATRQGDTMVVKSTPIKIHEFRVDSETLMDASEYFGQLLEQRPSHFEIHENDPGNVTGLTMWLKIAHHIVPDHTYELHIYEVWYVCSIAKKYGFDPLSPKAMQWFDEWYNHQPHVKHFNFRDYEQLILPTMTFDNATAFSHTTKYLAYRSNGAISETKPADFHPDNAEDVFTDPAIIVQLNSARNRLTTVLHRTLYAPISDFLGTSCKCAMYLLYSYEKGLANTGCWPLHPALEKMSMATVLENLSKFQHMPVQTCGKERCNIDLFNVVEKAIKDIEGQFAGLCLDCMYNSSTQIGKEEYWRHETFGVPWDQGCRAPHTQPSWFFSFMGNRAEMNGYLSNKTRERANSYSRDQPSSYGYGNNAFPRGGNYSRGNSDRGPRQMTRKSQRPGRHDSGFSQQFYPGGVPGHAIQDINARMTNSRISEVQDTETNISNV